MKSSRTQNVAQGTPHQDNPNAQLLPTETTLLVIVGMLFTIAVFGTLWGTYIVHAMQLTVWQPNAHGHSQLYAHGHPFVDARTVWGIPNTLDVLTNLPFAVGGLAGLWLLRRVLQLPVQTRQAAKVFFWGLILTCCGSSYYHWAPTPWGLALDRAGMAVAFAGIMGLVAADKVSQRAASIACHGMLMAALVAIAMQYAVGHLLPWIVVQFGGVGVVIWAAMQRSLSTGPSIRWSRLVGLYAIAKLLEMGDAAVFEATHAWVSGHSLKHIAASLAAWPVIAALHAHSPNYKP
jgi:hypothetical protein